MKSARQSFYLVFAIAAVLVVPATLALRAVIHPAVLQSAEDNPTPLGYRWSLLLFIIPIVVLAWWRMDVPELPFS